MNAEAWWFALFELGLRTENPRESLSSAIEAAKAGGISRESAAAMLSNYRDYLKRSGRGDDEDTVLEILDFVTGWASPHVQIWPPETEHP